MAPVSSPRTQMKTSFQLEVMNGDEEMVKMLLENGASIIIDIETLMSYPL